MALFPISYLSYHTEVQPHFPHHVSLLQSLFLLFLIFTGVQLLYCVVLVSTLQQGESATYLHASPLFWISFPLGLHRGLNRASCAYTVDSRQLSILYIASIMYISPTSPGHLVKIPNLSTKAVITLALLQLSGLAPSIISQEL